LVLVEAGGESWVCRRDRDDWRGITEAWNASGEHLTGRYESTY
jgi:hypothetical protein